MMSYWTAFLLPVLGGLSPLRPDRALRAVLYVLAFLALTLFIGGRDVVGCDWDTYVVHYYTASDETFLQALGQGYPAYSVLNWLAARTGFDVHGVNTVCAAIFSFGLLAFARRQPRPWLFLAAAMPYLVIVLAMGFTRQATALGFLMLAFNAFVDQKLVRFLVLVALAGLFHSSAVALAPMAVFMRRGRISPWFIGGAASAFLAVSILSNTLDRYVYSYVQQSYEAEGALYRLPLHATAAAAVLLFRKRWFARFEDGRLFVILAFAALLTFPFAFFLPVMADRMSMYLLPFQVAAAARVPDLLSARHRPLVIMGVVLAYGLSLYVWLTYANHASCWVPYGSVYF
jgi:hypothetical protein